MKPDAILFIDIDDSPDGRYSYREPHFAAARERGLACLTAAVRGRARLQRLQHDSHAVFLLDALSEQAILDLVGRLDGEYHVRAIFCHAGHASAQGQVGCIVARASRQLGLVYARPEAIAACNNKFLMRQELRNHQLRSVPFALCNDVQALAQEADRIGYPVIAKPAFGGASAFIKKCSNRAELQAHYTEFRQHHGEAACADFYGCAHTLSEEGEPQREYFPGRSLLLEGYIDGIEGTLECVIVGDRVHTLLINEKLMLTERSGTILENLLISPPVSFSPAQCEQIREYAKACLEATGLTNAWVHFEFRMTAHGPVVIEINPRLGGLYVNAALRDLAGIDPYALYIGLLLGDPQLDAKLDACTQRAADSAQSYAMLAVYPEQSGYFRGFEGLQFLEDKVWMQEYAVHETGSYINADIEEHYLLKCWAKVDGANHARALHEHFRQHLRAVIDNAVEA
jgi:biotin carboxylase